MATILTVHLHLSLSLSLSSPLLSICLSLSLSSPDTTQIAGLLLSAVPHAGRPCLCCSSCRPPSTVPERCHRRASASPWPPSRTRSSRPRRQGRASHGRVTMVARNRVPRSRSPRRAQAALRPRPHRPRASSGGSPTSTSPTLLLKLRPASSSAARLLLSAVLRPRQAPFDTLQALDDEHGTFSRRRPCHQRAPSCGVSGHAVQGEGGR